MRRVLVGAFAIASGCASPPVVRASTSATTARAALELSASSPSSSATDRSTPPSDGPATDERGCPRCGAPHVLATLREKALVETSGIVASLDHDGLFYVHNDSGDSARFFAVDREGNDRGTFDVVGAKAIDWEDIARGPCADPSKSCVYLGDIGDNLSNRRACAIYRVAEPTELTAGDHQVEAETFPFAYPDGAHDAETLLVHPTTGEVVVVTKGLGGSRAYSFPSALQANELVTLKLDGDVRVPELLALVTGGDVRRDGASILLRTYRGVYDYAVAPGESLSSALGREPCELPWPLEQQGEGIGFLPDGRGYVTASEGVDQPVHEVNCR